MIKLFIQFFMASMRKRKFKAFFRYFYDSNYRKQRNWLFQFQGTLGSRPIPREFDLRKIHASHDINYPDFVETLSDNILKTQQYEPISVGRTSDGLIVCINGHHRLAALKYVLMPGTKIKVNYYTKKIVGDI